MTQAANPARPNQPDDGHRRRAHLGRGLMALLGDDNTEAPQTERVAASRTLPVDLLKPGRYQPRMRFDDEQFKSLIDSVREKGILQPILVRRDPDAPQMYEIIAGERRWRAAQQAQLHEVPVVIRELADRDALELALVENIQRQDLTAIEEAEGYRRLMEEFGHTQEGLAQAVGKSRSHIANLLRLLSLPQPVRDMVQSAVLSAGHARALINASDPIGLAEQVVKKGLNVRQTEHLAQQARPSRPGRAAPAAKDADTVALERDLGALLGLKVSISFGRRGGELVIHYKTLEQLDDIVQRISQSAARPPLS
ncbi:MAG: ParB/RepB/Spo0J family partition protein [Alphaproteobacteria bacterium]|nr:ParB/RepB/Spo0J family partition protein [Alphaproteobacteria bacterium]